MNRDRHCTVAQLREVLDQLMDDDIICTDVPPSGHIPVIRGATQLGVIEMAAQDLVGPKPPSASLYLFDGPEL